MSQSEKAGQLPFRQSHAFIIGINDYEHITPLKTAVNDALGIAQRLEEQHAYTVHAPLLNAKKAAITEWLTDTIPQAVGAEDRVVFYFAGHGIALDSEEGPNGYLVPADAQPGDTGALISMNEFHQMLNALPCRHGLLILDCCFAGAFKWSTGFRGIVFDVPGVIYQERFWRYVQDPAWQVITSAAYDQQAVDVLSNRSLGMREENSGRHSPFAQALFEALEGQGDVIPQGEGDGVITATELYMYLRDQVEKGTAEQNQRQTPSLFNLARHDKGEYIFLHPRHRLNLPPAPDRNPFMGLSSFNEGDAPLFYGRGRVVEALDDMAAHKRLLVVSGASGTGKSSVIKAGLLPKLRRDGWQVLPVIRPGKEPMATLEAELPDAEKQFRENGKTILVIDQYEELITQCLDPAQRQAFEQQLVNWLNTFPDLRIILSIRSDFEPQFEGSPLTPWWQAGRYVVPAFSLDELREVIVRPANQEVLFYEPEELVDQLVEEVSQAPGALPLLSFTLSELYEAYLKSGRQDRALLEADYQQLGGVVGALRTKADEVYNRQDEHHQNSMRKLMLRMASLEGGELAGKRVYEEELQFSDAAETRRTTTVAHQLVDARLVQRGVDAQGRVYVEPAHDALVRAWGRLWEWVKATGEEKLSLQNKLSQAVKDYQAMAKAEPKKSRRLLWNDNPRLGLLEAALQNKGHGLNASEEAFVRASVKRRKARRRQLIGSLLAALAIFAVLAFVANGQRIIADENARAEQRQRERVDSTLQVVKQQRNEALSSNLATKSALTLESDPTVAFRLAEASLQYDSTNTLGEGALLSAFYASADLTAGKAGYLYQQVEAMPPALAAAAAEKRMDEREESRPFREFMPNWGAIVQKFYSPRDQFLFQLHQDQHGPFTATVWNFDTQEYLKVEIGEAPAMFSPYSFTPDEQHIVIPARKVAEVWPAGGRLPVVCKLPAPFYLTQAFFDEQAKNIYAETSNGNVYKWNLEGYPIARLGIPDRELGAVFIGSDGKNIVLNYPEGYDDAAAEAWSEEGGRWTKQIGSFILSKDEKSVTGGGNPIDISSYKKVDYNTYRYSRYGVTRDTSANGQYEVVIDNKSKSITIHPLGQPETLLELLGHERWIESVSFSPDGRFILTSSNNEMILWDWDGNNVFSLPRGGIAGFLPGGGSIFLWPTTYMEYYEIGQIDLFTIDVKELVNWADENEVYQLSEEDRRKYGVVE